jgi:hypothetical protein
MENNLIAQNLKMHGVQRIEFRRGSFLTFTQGWACEPPAKQLSINFFSPICFEPCSG